MEATPSPDSDIQEVTREKAELIDRCTSAYLTYTLECYDKAKSEGNNVLQWLFAVVAGGMAMIGPVAMAGHWWLAVALCSPVARAAFIASRLVPQLNSKNTMPPGNYAACLNSMLGDTAERMLWREAQARDARIRENNKEVEKAAVAVDAARIAFAQLHWWFWVPAVVAAIVQYVRPAA